MTGLPALQLANSNDLKQGQVVFAFGSPLGLENSVSMGVVSATSRQIDPDKPDIYIQTDAPINPGNSGGPLVDIDGHVVGINTFILSESGGNEGLGFAIPSDVVRSVYDQIRTEGHVHRGQIGVYLRTITPELAEGLHLPVDEGVILEDVVPGSSADKAGLKVGEIVTSVGGKQVDDLRQFALDLYAYKVGQKVDVGVLRKGKVQTVAVTVSERTDDPERFADMVTGPDNLVNRSGDSRRHHQRRAARGSRRRSAHRLRRAGGGAHAHGDAAGRRPAAGRCDSRREWRAGQGPRTVEASLA